MLKAGADKALFFVKDRNKLLLTDWRGHCQATLLSRKKRLLLTGSVKVL